MSHTSTPSPSGDRAWHMAWVAVGSAFAALAAALATVHVALRMVIAHSGLYFDVFVAELLTTDFSGTVGGFAAGSGVPVDWRMSPFSGHITAAWAIGEHSRLLLVGAGPFAGASVLAVCTVVAARRLALPCHVLIISAAVCYAALTGIAVAVAEQPVSASGFEMPLSTVGTAGSSAAWALLVGGAVIRWWPFGPEPSSVRGAEKARRSGVRAVAVMAVTGLIASLVSVGAAAATPADPTGVANRQKWRAPGVDKAVDALGTEKGHEPYRANNSGTGTPSMLGGLHSPLGGHGVLGWLGTHAKVFGVGDTDGMLRKNTRRVQPKDRTGATHAWYDQVMDGVPVFGAQVGVHLDRDGRTVTAVTNGLRPDLIPPASMTPGIDRAEAVRTAVKAVPGGRSTATPGLVVYAGVATAGVRTPAYLTWQVDLTDETGRSTRVFVDALNAGRFVAAVPLSMDALDREVRDMQHSTRENGTFPLVRTEDSSPSGDKDADDAYNQSGATYNYYRVAFGRDSIDGLGMTLSSRVHYQTGYKNAFWSNSRMTYGDGMLSQDVTAHEMTHGVTEHTANLTYQYQSGALNEAISDIFGEMTERYVKGRTDWLLGTDLDAMEPIRSMSDPTAYGHPKHMDQYRTTCADNGGVHSNSGIINYAFYRMATLYGSFPAEQIMYRALTHYLTSGSDFAAAYAAVMTATRDLHGADSIITSTTNSVWTNNVGINGNTPDPRPANCGTGLTCTILASLYDSGDALNATGVPVDDLAGSLVHLYQVSVVDQSPAAKYYGNLFFDNREEVEANIPLQGELLDRFVRALQLWKPVIQAVGTSDEDDVLLTQEQIDAANDFADGLIAAMEEAGLTAKADLAKAQRALIDDEHVVGLSITQLRSYLDAIAEDQQHETPPTGAPSLAATFDNVGVTQDGGTSVGDLDGTGSSLSTQALANAGVTPGAALGHAGLGFTWPATAPRTTRSPRDRSSTSAEPPARSASWSRPPPVRPRARARCTTRTVRPRSSP
ncbi:M4 family metallopeptidase [Streptomyces sp. NPDC046909]|uniref:M4 family metallopeptidase n=1 Tax=Streptomyces sp. NPDC046909 TaxID=3155617 RepID=UPI0033E56D13